MSNHFLEQSLKMAAQPRDRAVLEPLQVIDDLHDQSRAATVDIDRQRIPRLVSHAEFALAPFASLGSQLGVPGRVLKVENALKQWQPSRGVAPPLNFDQRRIFESA